MIEPAAGRDHRLDHRADAEEHADLVDGDDPLVVGERVVDDPRRVADAGVVDEHVEPAEALDGGVDDGLPRCLVGHVVADERHVVAELGGQRLALLGEDVGGDHLGPLGGEQAHLGLALAREPPVTIATLPSSRPTAEPPIWPVARARSWRCTTGGPLRCEPGQRSLRRRRARSHARSPVASPSSPGPPGASGGRSPSPSPMPAPTSPSPTSTPNRSRASSGTGCAQRVSGPEEEVSTAAAVAALGRRSTSIAVDVSDAGAGRGRRRRVHGRARSAGHPRQQRRHREQHRLDRRRWSPTPGPTSCR